MYLTIFSISTRSGTPCVENAPPKPGDIPPELLQLLQPEHQYEFDGLAARSALSYCNHNAAYNESCVFQGWLNARKAYKQQPQGYEEPVEPGPYYRHVNYETAYALIRKGQSPPMPPEYSWQLRRKV